MEPLPCIKCGAAPGVIGRLCEECYRNDIVLCEFPPSVKVTVCVTCGAFASKSRWLRADSSEGAIESRITEQTLVHPDLHAPQFTFGYNWTDPNLTRVSVSLTASVEGAELTEKGQVVAKVRLSVCDACSRKSGAYFEAIIQLRSAGRKIDEEEKERAEWMIHSSVMRAAKNDDNAFITKAEEVRGGYDYYLSQRPLAEKISKSLAADFGAVRKSSPALIGRKDGKDQYRVTHLIRLPPYRVGDFIDLYGLPSASVREGAPPFRVVSITAHFTLLRQLRTGDERKMQRNEMEHARIVARREDVQRAVVVSEGENLIQIMHPSTFKTVDANRPKFEFTVTDGSTDVLVLEETIFILFEMRNIPVTSANLT